MKYWSLLILSGLFYFPSLGQPNPGNLDFEQRNPYNILFPWYKGVYSKPTHLVTLDSQIVHHGRYSLRFTYDTVSKGISVGSAHNNLVIDVVGKKIKLSAWYRQSNPTDSSSSISFLASTDIGETKWISRSFKLTGGDAWTQNSREFDLDTVLQPLHHIRININTKTKDTLWVDDLQVEVDGKNMYETRSFASAKDEVISNLSTQQVDNLQKLCQIWGFLKYFHPQVAKGKFNWDMELFKMIPMVKAAGNIDTLNTIFLNWINSLGEVPECKNCYTSFPATVITYNLDWEWMKSSGFSDDLKNKLNYIIANRWLGKHQYVQYRSMSRLLFTNENEYNWREIGYPNLNFRLLLLFRYWNQIQYFFPYKNVIGKDWNTVLHEFVGPLAEVKDYVTYYLLMSKLVNSINDSHAGFSSTIVFKELVAFSLPVRTSIIDDKAVVTGFRDDSLAAISGLQIGDVIEKVGDQTIKQVIDEKIPYINGSNYTVKLAFMSSWDYIMGGKDSVVQLQLNRNGKRLATTVKRYSSFPFQQRTAVSKWKILPGNIGYVDMGLLLNKEIDSMFADLRNTKALIFDLRHYPNGTVYDICAYLYEKPMEFAKLTYSNLDYPGTFLWGTPFTYGPIASSKNKFHYTGRTIILVNENTQSQAEWTTMAFQAVPGAITIGSQTSGADGDVVRLVLPGNVATSISGLGVFYPDGTPTQRVGVRVDVTIHPTVQGIREKRDEVLEKAIEIVNK